MVDLKQGDIIYGGLPGQSNYYTNLDTVLASQGNKAVSPSVSIVVAWTEKLLGGKRRDNKGKKYAC